MISDDDDLLPCPFCGGKATFEPRVGDLLGFYVVACECGVETGWYDEKIDAELHWNTRVIFPPNIIDSDES